MALYEYVCEANGVIVEVRHKMDVVIRNWGELCFAAQIPLGDIDFTEPVRKRMSAAAISIPLANSKLKNEGFTKLVKRDQGVYENVTAGDGEQRYMKRGDKKSVPHLHKKIKD